MISISVSDLSYKIGEKVILDSVSFSLDAGDRLGIVGVNGAGKSTLINIITGIIGRDSGSISFTDGNDNSFFMRLSSVVNIFLSFHPSVGV